MEVKAAPGSATPSPYQHQARRQYQFFANVEQVKASAVHQFRRVHILPRNQDEQIQEKPPGKQKGEIERSDSPRAVILFNMRLDGHGGHHRYNVQKKNHVPDKWIWRLMP